MEKIIKFSIFAWAMIMLASCSLFDKEKPYGTEAQLLGKWQNEGIDTTWYRVFYADPVEDTDGYKWGKEWVESDGVIEDDLTLHGNGWFKWRKNNANMLEIEMMEYGWADIPYEYSITLLNNNRLEYTEMGRGRKLKFNKVK